ncbi:MAG: hypothetical protein ACTMIL_10160 [Brevibacterium aurantiacum]
MASRSKFIPGKDAKAAIRSGSRRGVALAAEHLLGESRRVVPIEEGTLERSMRASTTANGSEVTGAVSADTPYCVVQHEDLSFRHDKGRSAKYIERPLNANRGKFGEIIAASLRGEL